MVEKEERAGKGCIVDKEEPLVLAVVAVHPRTAQAAHVLGHHAAERHSAEKGALAASPCLARRIEPAPVLSKQRHRLLQQPRHVVKLAVATRHR